MKIQKIDVELEIPEGELLDFLGSTSSKNALAKEIVERLRTRADQVAREAGGRLQTDTLPEFYVRRGSHVTFGGDYILAASRWVVEVPESFDPQRAAGLSR